jgi:IclR family transcriptional regulator, acetate operon repressor
MVSRCQTIMESVKTALRVLELVGDTGPIGVSELARETGEPKSTVQRNLVTLHEAGWIRPIEAAGRRRWTLTTKVLTLARHLQPAPGLRDAALEVMEKLRTRTRETIHLTLRDGDNIVLIERLDSPQSLRTVRPLGASAPLHLSSNGKAILAHLPEAEQSEYLKRHLDAWTPKSLCDPHVLARDLNLVRRRGFALNDGELDVQIRAVAAPIFLSPGRPVAGLSISCPATRLPDSLVDEYGKFARRAAQEISSRLADGRAPKTPSQPAKAPPPGSGGTRGNSR